MPIAEFRALGGKDDVAAEQKLQTARDRDAVRRADHRHRNILDALEDALIVLQRVCKPRAARPNTVVLTPSDATEVDACLRAALAYKVDSPIYIRLGRGPEYVFNAPSQTFDIGKAVHLRHGNDIAIVANGSMVFEALLAADLLKTLGIHATVLNLHTIKPIDDAALRAIAASCSAIIVVEEHSVHGGLGAAVLEAISECPRAACRLLGIRDVFPPIGPPHELRAHLGLSAPTIATHALDLLR